MLVVAIRNAPKASDVQNDTDNQNEDEGEEQEVPLRPGTGSLIHGGRVPASREVRDQEASDTNRKATPATRSARGESDREPESF